ncbi:hypothetical protein DPMN_006519 [Dreissena polymorpha]|uniref:Uncharacterized protein n=1 Tax=Dreissena polymorpha TaxID=45954 RepID=A0A9D4MRL0_DREPO|nr:hypothetical protein DPMN_006519 [Dreissena polymorpha]
MFSQPGDMDCPIEVYKIYADKRPEKMRKPEAPFYVAVNPNWKPDANVNWYMNAKIWCE